MVDRHEPATQPDGHRRLRVRRVHGARSRGAPRAVRKNGLPGSGAPPFEERDPAPPGRHQFSDQRRAEQLRAAVCARSRRLDLRDGLSGARRGAGLQACARARGGARADYGGPDGAEYPVDQGHRREPDLPGRPLRGEQHLRHRLPADQRPARARWPGPPAHRSPDAQRKARQHGSLVGFLRAAVQFPSRSATSTSRARRPDCSRAP